MDAPDIVPTSIRSVWPLLIGVALTISESLRRAFTSVVQSQQCDSRYSCHPAAGQPGVFTGQNMQGCSVVGKLTIKECRLCCCAVLEVGPGGGYNKQAPLLLEREDPAESTCSRLQQAGVQIHCLLCYQSPLQAVSDFFLLLWRASCIERPCNTNPILTSTRDDPVEVITQGVPLCSNKLMLV